MKLKIFLTFLLAFVAQFCFSQTYKAVYVCYLNYTAEHKEMEQEEQNKAYNIVPEKSKIIYEVICNAKVQEINAFLDSVATNVLVHANKTSLFTNIASRTIYFPEEGTFKKLVFHSTDSTDAGKQKYFIEGYSRAHYYKVDTKLPFYINPGFFVKNTKTAITEIHTPGFTIQLLSVKKVKTKLTVHPDFKKAGDLKGKSFYSLLE